MRVVGVALILLVAASVMAPLPAPAQGTAQPKAAAAAKKPAAPAPKQAAPASTARDAATLADRVAAQLDLAWAGYYNGLITGESSDKVTAAVKAFQKDHRFKETGTLAPPERAALAAISKSKQDEVGWRMVDDKVTGAQIGLPTKEVPDSMPGRNGTRWTSGHGQIQVETFRIREPGTTLAGVFEQQKKEPAGRRIEVNLLRPDFFILSGMQGLKKFYVRAAIRDGEVRGMTILYDQATEGMMDPVEVVMSSAFAPFPGTGLAALMGAPAKSKVQYATGIVVTAAGHVVTDTRATAECGVITIAGRGDAFKLAQDESGGIALLRIFAGPDLVPASLRDDAASASNNLTLIGIADPQAQGGGSAVSTVSSRLDGSAIEPMPPAGFDGAAALDGQGRLAGMVAMADATAGGRLIPAVALRKFLDAQSVAPSAGAAGLDATKAALVRVICVRK
jgi:peptidoglycan hydrolase-like protein with peptidoglycan-binding domain